MPTKRNEAVAPDRAPASALAEAEFERSLRPREFGEFTGQEGIIAKGGKHSITYSSPVRPVLVRRRWRISSLMR
jgi:hypothetical protein